MICIPGHFMKHIALSLSEPSRPGAFAVQEYLNPFEPQRRKGAREREGVFEECSNARSYWPLKQFNMLHEMIWILNPAEDETQPVEIVRAQIRNDWV